MLEEKPTQEQAAETAKADIPRYQKIEDGSVNVTLQTAELLPEAFGVDIVDCSGAERAARGS